MVVARILDVVPHPDADKLPLVDVDFGDGHDARRVRRAEHRRRAWSCRSRRSGATLPGGFTLERRKIRGAGVATACCARRRSSASATTTPASSSSTRRAELGADVREVLGLDDVSSTSRSRRTGPTRCASSASPASSPRTSRSPLDVPEPRRAAPTRRSPSDITRRGRGARPLPALPRSGRAGHDGGVARLDGAAAREGGHAADQQRRRRHQLRDARAQPAAARVRPRPARAAAGSSCGSPTTARR